MISALSRRFGKKCSDIRTSVDVGNPLNGKRLASMGIWDTGATHSLVTKKAARNLGLPTLQRTWVRGVHSKTLVNVYLVEITLNNKNISVRTRVSECDELSDDGSVDILIGMDIITMGDLCISNHKGNTAMTFRVPSLETVDYVADINEHNKYVKIHDSWLQQGNDKCPCGSGRKWENCHGKSIYT